MTTTCAIELISATLVPGRSGRWKSASMCGERTRSMARGSATMSFAPSRSRRFMRDANTGWPSVGLAPMTKITSLFITESNAWVPADSPSVCFRPYPVGEWQTRAQVSTLFVPSAARTSFCTRNDSSLVQREEVMPPTDSRPYCAWMRRNSDAA